MSFVESMMSVREKPWHNLGVACDEAPTSADALKMAGLDWTVESRPVYNAEGKEIPGYRLNERSSDHKPLGIVSPKYRIVQNADAFEFTDGLIGGDVRYETAGSLNGGKHVWLLARLPETKVVGDVVEPYICFRNTHDGTGAIKVCMTPIRVVCNNTLNLALRTAKRSWSAIHVGDFALKAKEAAETLELASQYMEELDEFADRMANTPLKMGKVKELVDKMFAYDDEASERVKNGMLKLRADYMKCYMVEDNRNFIDTAWGALNAMADMTGHNEPRRKTKNFAENNWGAIMNGHWMSDKFEEMVLDTVAA